MGSQLVANGGDNEGLFRAAVLSCGFQLPTGDVSLQQPFFDSIAAAAGCSYGTGDKLECLRGIPAENLTAAAASLPSFFGYKVGVDGVPRTHGLTWFLSHQGLSAPQWFPHADGTFLREPVRDAVLAGRIADVPFIAGKFPSPRPCPLLNDLHR